MRILLIALSLAVGSVHAQPACRPVFSIESSAWQEVRHYDQIDPFYVESASSYLQFRLVDSVYSAIDWYHAYLVEVDGINHFAIEWAGKPFGLQHEEFHFLTLLDSSGAVISVTLPSSSTRIGLQPRRVIIEKAREIAAHHGFKTFEENVWPGYLPCEDRYAWELEYAGRELSRNEHVFPSLTIWIDAVSGRLISTQKSTIISAH